MKSKEYPRALVISGSPGCGKTSVSSALAEAVPRGLHLLTDEFFGFIAHAVDPSLPESKKQNEAVGRAYLAAARSFLEDDYDVMIDGVIGDWWFYLLKPVLGSFDYVILHAPLDVTLSRCEARDGQYVKPDVLRRMHPQFEKLVERMPQHFLDTSERTVDEVAEEVIRLRSAGQLRIEA